MVAQIVRQGTETFHGVRALNPGRDLRQVALLLEEAFRQDLGAMHAWSQVPVIRDIGAALLSTAFMPVPPENLRGFVYEENGRIVGNVTLTLDDHRSSRWLISNVAVAETYRRRGIARQMMLASLDEARARGVRWVVLNVRPWNVGAEQLYEQLGFEVVDTESQYLRTRARPYPYSALPIRRLHDRELRTAYELARAGMNEHLRMFRPPPISEFGVRIEDRVAERALDFFILQSTERWGYFEDDMLLGAVTLRAQRVGSPHNLSIFVAPTQRGQIEPGLIAAALERLHAYPARDIQARALASHTELVSALTGAAFVPTRGLTLMAKEIHS